MPVVAPLIVWGTGASLPPALCRHLLRLTSTTLRISVVKAMQAMKTMIAVFVSILLTSLSVVQQKAGITLAA